MFKLMVVTDRKRCKMPLTEMLRLAIEGGVDAVQLREKDLEAGELTKLAEELRKITAAAGAKLIINHRTDIALAVGADGVHLGWRSVDVRDARALAGDKLTIGLSCHDGAQLRQAQEAGADYAILGPLFPTPSKEGLVPPLHAAGFKRVVSNATIPVLAIGGITPANVRDALIAGASGVAVISAIVEAADPKAAAKALRA